MANDLKDTLRDRLGDVARDAVKNLGDTGSGKRSPLSRATPSRFSRDEPSPVSGAKGVAAGAALVAVPLLAKKGVDTVRSLRRGPAVASKLGDQVGDKLKDTASQKIDEAGGLGGIARQAAGGLLGGGADGGGGGGVPGVGKGRRMPVQQSMDVAVPIETAYNQWTQFEDWPEFMHRVTRVTQEDDCTVSFATKIWGKTKEFVAEIETQRPEERIKWRVSQGITHTGVVTFHELGPRLTRVELNVDVDPGSLLEKAARGMRNIKRAMRADLHRFKAYIEMQEIETGAWRGVIEEGELVEEHPEDYDSQREYSDVEDARPEQGDEEGPGDAEEPREGRQEEPPRRARREKAASKV
jgi:uncharacterized membrane protein